MNDTSVSNAVAVREQTGPAAMVETYRDEYAALMPSHLNPDQWVRMAVGAIRGDNNLVQAASNDIGVFLRELRTAARLGLEPGTEQFYLTPRKVKGTKVIKGIVGYQGIIELIYRAGAASAVIVESVRERDRFQYVPGRDERPVHEIDWFGEDRGALVGVYAYAVMKDGATSKVVVLNRRQIDAIKAKSDSKNSEYSPWNTNPESMWLKSAVRQLMKWVPTSAEYMREQLRAQAEVAAEHAAVGDAPLPPAPSVELGDEDEDGPIEGEIVHDAPSGGWPTVTQPAQ
jgi:recombination protein RecT